MTTVFILCLSQCVDCWLNSYALCKSSIDFIPFVTLTCLLKPLVMHILRVSPPEHQHVMLLQKGVPYDRKFSWEKIFCELCGSTAIRKNIPCKHFVLVHSPMIIYYKLHTQKVSAKIPILRLSRKFSPMKISHYMEFTSVELKNCWSQCAVRPFWGNAIPCQQHWADSIQKPPNNHSKEIGC